MNTMADGAAQRLVAQIGEALFGQPGLNLMELAERVKGMRSPLLIEEEPLPADMRLGSADYLDYLDAHPSPAGQGDALAALQQEYDKLLAAFDRQVEAAEKIAETALQQDDRIEELEEALAARQQVGSEFVISRTMEGAEAASDGMLPAALAPVADEWYRLCERRFAVDRIRISGKLAEAIVEAVCTARQPVGREPVAWMTHHDEPMLLPTAAEAAAYCEYDEQPVPLYAAPPAQAVDLAARPMETAPRDGTMVRLLVQFDENATEDTAGPAWTIGACNDDNVGEDGPSGWQFSGWCWTHDHFAEGSGTPVGWLPLIDSKAVGNG